jgi:Bacteriophage head to tail connecting protein
MPDEVFTPGGRRPRESEAPNPEQLVARWQKLKSQRANVDTVYQEIADYVIPRKAVIQTPPVEGAELTEHLWDSTAIRANELLAARIQGALTSPSIRWFSLKTRSEEVNRLYAVRTWLNQVEEALYLALRQSNFNAEIGEVYLDLGAFGTGAMLMEAVERQGLFGFMFHALAPGTYCLAENFQGEVDTVFRELRMTLRQIAQQFGKDVMPDGWKDAVDRTPDAEQDVLHVIAPRRVDNPDRKDNRHWPWMSVYLAVTDKVILEEGGYQEFPCLVARWAKTTGEVYGRGPGHTALPDIRTLNKAVELTLQSASKALNPPGLVSSDAAIAELDLRPGSQNTVEGDPRMAWTPLESGAKFDVSKILTEEWRGSIRNTFYWDNLQLQSERVMTATEVQRRLELMQQFLAPTLARLESEALTPLINRVFAMMYRQRQVPTPPPELAGANLDVEYEGPLARSQKATRLAGFEEYLRILGPAAQLQPQIMDQIDFDAAARDLAEVAGLPAQYLRDEDDITALRQQRATQQEMQNRLQVAGQAAEAAGKMAPAVTAMQDMQLPPGLEGGDLQEMLAGAMGGGQNGGAPPR